jgi:Ser/Thr protein kinase RdoA (MazF antagonist)
MQLLEHVPRFDTQSATSLAWNVYGMRTRATRLPSERDQNFLLSCESDLTRGGDEKFVLKIANALEDRALLEAQNGALAHLATSVSFCPLIVPNLSGDLISQTELTTGDAHFLRLMTWLPGMPLAEVSSRSPELLNNLGRKLGQLDRELQNFDHPAIHRDFHWDLANGSRVVREYQELITDPKLRDLVHRCATDFEDNIGPLLPGLRRSVIHGDANDHNILVSVADVDERDRTVVGLIDFGDMVHSFTVGDLAVAIAYVILEKRDPLQTAVQVAAGYHEEYPLNKEEIDALYGLVLMRLCMSACLATHQHRQLPDNEYLEISQHALRNSLPALAAIEPRTAAGAFREACQFE